MNKRKSPARRLRAAPVASDQVMFSLMQAAGTIEHRLETALGEVGLSLPKFGALTFLVKAGEPLSLGECANRMICVRSNITQLVDRLEADGLVARQADPHDRRGKLAALTADGRKVVKEGVRVLESAEKEVLNRLTHDEAHQLHTLLGKIGTGR